MVNKKARGKRAKTRALLKRRNMPSVTVNKLMQEFHEGQKVRVTIDPSVHSGMPDARFHGFTGVVVGKQGKALKVALWKGFLKKNVIIGTAHLDPEKSS